MEIVGVAAVVALLIVIALLMGHIKQLGDQMERLRDDLMKTLADSARLERVAAREAAEMAGHTLDRITDGLKQQVEMMQKSMQVAWNPQPQQPTQLVGTSGNPAVDRIMAKYGFDPAGYRLPVPADVQEHDMGKDPTDDYLTEDGMPPRTNAAMLPADPPTTDNPTGIPGFQARW